MNREVASAGSATSPPLIETKLARPRARSGLIPRGRLFERLDTFGGSELTLLSAPAGSGKSVLVETWLASRPALSAAWVHLDAADDDPVRFWTYVAHAVDRLRPGMARPALARLQTTVPAVGAAVDELMNGLATYAGSAVIVLDDLHHVHGEEALGLVARAVQHAPVQARFVACTRADPAIGIAPLRASGALGELRAADLAFTVEEAGLVLQRAGLRLAPPDVELLVDRTEGWPAGVSLAALWLAAVDDPSAGVTQFAGDNRHVADYLSSEVLDAVDPQTRSFLVRTSVLGRLSASLCDAVLERDDASTRLAEIARTNLFLVPLDGVGEWFRYHHLFARLLRVFLAAEAPAEIPVLHRRASEWFHERRLLEEALEHSAAAGDERATAELLVAEHAHLLRSGGSSTLLTWVRRLGDGTLTAYPELPGAGALASGLLRGPRDERAGLLALAERAKEGLSGRRLDYVSAACELARAAFLDQGVDAGVESGRRAVELSRDALPEQAVAALGSLAQALWLAGAYEEAVAIAQEAVDRPEARERPHGMLLALAVLSLVHLDAGRPNQAEAEAARALEVAGEPMLADAWTAAPAYLAHGRALRALGRGREAERELARAEQRAWRPDPSLVHACVLIHLARIRIELGRLAAAASDLESAREVLSAFADAGVLPELFAAARRELAVATASAESAEEHPTAAELAVLRLLATDLSRREIGAELFLSLNTVKTHVRALYRKLGVTSREEVVRRAATLGLLDEPDAAA